MAISKEKTSTEEMMGLLLAQFKRLGNVAVGFSGGVDSTVVLAAAIKALGPDNVLAVTSGSETMPGKELEEARRLAHELGAWHEVIETCELENERFSENSPERCYHCKLELWDTVRSLAGRRGINSIADGVNADDLDDHRPGIRASDEMGVLHPLAKIGAGKSEVRSLARTLNLSNWDKPAQACLSSRFPYGTPITEKGLKRIELAEEYLRGLGLDCLRVRDHGDIARIEVPGSEIAKLAVGGMREEIVAYFKKLGYFYVTLDLEGFRSGSMNEVLYLS